MTSRGSQDIRSETAKVGQKTNEHGGHLWIQLKLLLNNDKQLIATSGCWMPQRASEEKHTHKSEEKKPQCWNRQALPWQTAPHHQLPLLLSNYFNYLSFFHLFFCPLRLALGILYSVLLSPSLPLPLPLAFALTVSSSLVHFQTNCGGCWSHSCRSHLAWSTFF